MKKISKQQETLSPEPLWVVFEFRGQQNWRKKENPQNMCLTATPSGDVAQILAIATNEWGLDREARVACIG